MHVAIIGGGVAGASCARALVDAGHQVSVFDKGRGPGGRLSTRREGALTFDHGAQYFTVTDERVGRLVRGAAKVEPWQPKLGVFGEKRRGRTDVDASALPKRFVAVPGMSALLQHLQQGLDVHFGVKVDGITRDETRFTLIIEGGTTRGPFDAVVVATPAPQATPLLAGVSSALADQSRLATYSPTWAAMVAFDARLPLELDAAFVNEGPLSWVARESSKPGRGDAERWVLHASPEWSQEHLEDEADAVVAPLLQAFFSTTGVAPRATSFQRAHRWRYALVTKPLGRPCLTDGHVLACGDWCLGPRIEAAALSGLAAAEALTRG